MLSLEELQLKIEDMTQAIALERRHRFVNLQGRKKTFGQYLKETLRELAAIHLLDGETMQGLQKRVERYATMDMPQRVGVVVDTESLIAEVKRLQAEPRRKTALKESTIDETAGTGSETSPRRALHEIQAREVRGIGPNLTRLLSLAGIQTVEDLLYYFPRRYIDYQQRAKIASLEEGQDVTVIATIRSAQVIEAKNKPLSIARLMVQDETGRMAAHWFYNKKTSKALLSQFRSRYVKDTEVMLSGRVKFDAYNKCYAMDRPQVEVLSFQGDGPELSPDNTADKGPEGSNFIHTGRIVPVYPLTEGLHLLTLRRCIFKALQGYLSWVQDPLPESFRGQYGYQFPTLMPLHQALEQIHFPDSMEQSAQARERLVFDELFYLQARLALMRKEYKRSVSGLSLEKPVGGYADRLIDTLPFALTGAQQRSFQEILDDLRRPEPMYRLLHGDVGSGKTVVSALALLVAVDNGYQGALMAPTEILAEQHYRKFTEWLTPLGLRVGLLIGKLGAKERRETLQGLLNGQIHVAIGTQALIQDAVEFHKLGLVVIDEQHRFGVRQRTKLKSKGEHPELLTMTATPIPRTLALTVHGDLDVSKLDERPPGRTPIRTLLFPPSKHSEVYQLIRLEILKGRQAYVVLPLIEESETLTAKAATTEAERLATEVFPDMQIGLLHGKLANEEKDRVMQDFLAQKTQILVSTTVVEVGVDVPNATVMVIENADRFGLAQLHQLRGRVGRGTHQSFCVLLSASRTPETLERLNILVETEDGFEIAEKDLAIRGPGEFLGTRQSGLPDLLLADLIQDQGILENARKAAFDFVETPEMALKYPELYGLVLQKSEKQAILLNSG